MSTYWFYRIDMPVTAHAPVDTEALVFRLEPFLMANQVLGAEHPSAPSFGDGFTYEGRDFSDVTGVSIGDGRFRAGIFDSNLERPLHSEDDIEEYADWTQLQIFFSRLSSFSAAEPGEIVGCIADEGMIMHADPIVIGADRQLYKLETLQDEDFGQNPYAHLDRPSGPDLVVGERIPLSSIVVTGRHSAKFDTQAYRAARVVEA